MLKTQKTPGVYRTVEYFLYSLQLNCARSETYLDTGCCYVNISRINHRDLPRISTLNQVGVEGGQRGSRHAHNGNNNENTGAVHDNMNSGSTWVDLDDPQARYCNKKLHSLRRVATADDTTPRIDQIQGLP